MRAGLDPFLDGLDRSIRLETLRVRARYQLTLDEFRGLFVSDEQVDALIAGGYAGLPKATVRFDWKSAVAELVRDCPPVARLARLGLSSHALAVLLVAAAPGIDPRYEPLFAYLNDDAARRLPTEMLMIRLLADDEGDARAIRQSLRPESVLRSTGLVRTVAGQEGVPSQVGIAIHPGVLSLLHGEEFHDEHVAAALTHRCPEPGTAVSTALVADQSAQVRRALTASARVIGVTASSTVSAPAFALGLCALWGCQLTCLDIARLPRDGVREGIRRAVLCAALADTPLLIEGRTWSPEDNGGDAHLCELPRLIGATGAIVLIDLADAPPPAAAGPLIHVAAPSLQPPAQLALWHHQLAAHSLSAQDSDLVDLALRFRLGVEAIEAVARRLADDGGETARHRLFAAARAVSDAGLARLAQRLPQRKRFDQLVLPADTRARARGLIDALANQHRVLGEWGFERTVSAPGLRALFAGPPGTGKTMAAGVIAHELGLDCYRIDLSQIVSKWIGETEKNLERVFRGASASRAILFFDEADALFGKRSEVKDAQDRFANIETAYLLQRIDEFDGIIFLASNISRNIDPAFARRMQFVIEFPQPGVEERLALWRAAFPDNAPVDANIDFEFLARRFDLSGGDISNVVLDAAFLASCGDDSIGMRHLVQAVARELIKQGRSPSASDFRQHFTHLDPISSAA